MQYRIVLLVLLSLCFSCRQKQSIVETPTEAKPDLQARASALKLGITPFEDDRGKAQLGSFYSCLLPFVYETVEISEAPDRASQKELDKLRDEIARERMEITRQILATGASSKAISKASAHRAAEWFQSKKDAFLPDGVTLNEYIPDRIAQSLVKNNVVKKAEFVPSGLPANGIDIMVTGKLLKGRQTVRHYAYYSGVFRYMLPFFSFPLDAERIDVEYSVHLTVPGTDKPFASFTSTGGGIEFERKLYDSMTTFSDWKNGPTTRLFKNAVNQAERKSLQSFVDAVPYEGVTFRRIQKKAKAFHQDPPKSFGTPITPPLAVVLIETGSISLPGSQAAVEKTSGTRRDIEKMELFFLFDENGPQIPQENLVKVLGDSATPSGVSQAVGNMGEKLKGKGTLVVYCTGRGAAGWLESTKKIDLLLMTSASDLGTLSTRSIGLSELISLVEKQSAIQKILIIDAGFNGQPEGRSVRHPAKDLIKPEYPRAKLLAVYASLPGQGAEMDKQLSGIFTSALLDALKDKARTFEAAFLSAKQKVETQTSGRQTPTIARPLKP